ncbi:hypothetical protein LJB77_00385 [Ruminococcaceae bacterium OttesenSCG-928-N02]|nr:hypothetical protein [Ruminococcaceae bacterium OttesenSCG-928-N02]
MLGFLEISLVFSAILIFCAFYVLRLRGNAAMAPLFVIAGSMLYMSVVACFNQLVMGVALYFVCAVATLVYMLVRRKTLHHENDFFTPGMIFFIAGSVLFMALYAVRQPIFTEWDEFSFWGVAPKLVTLTGQMYSAIDSSLRALTFTPGLIAYDYLFQSFAVGFAPWKVYCAYNIMYLAVFAAALAPFSKKEKRVHSAPLALFCFLVPFLCTEYLRLIYVSPVYRGALSDIPLGIMFGAPLLAYFASDEKDFKTMLLVVVCLACETLVKDMGFALALVAAGIIAFDYFFIENGLEHIRAATQKVFAPLVKRVGWCAALFAAPVAAFKGWDLHMRYFLNLNRTDIGGEQEMQMMEMLFTGIRELFSSVKSEKFSAVMQAMINAFLDADITLFGSGLCMVAVIGLLLLIAYITSDKKGRGRTAWFSLLSAGGFLVFYIFTGFTYVYVFKGSDGYGLVSYNRYIYPYYIGWLLCAALLAFMAVHPGKTGGRGTESENTITERVGLAGSFSLAFYTLGVLPYVFFIRKFMAGTTAQRFARAKPLVWVYYGLWLVAGAVFIFLTLKGVLKARKPSAAGVRLACKGVLLVFVAVCTWRWASYVRPDLCFINYPDSHESGLRLAQEQTEKDIAGLPADSRTFFVWQGDDGLQWFMHCYYFLPNTLDYSFGGGTLADPAVYDAGISMTAQQLCAYLQENECTYLYLGHINGVFEESYGALFEDELSAWHAGDSRLYKVVQQNGGMTFVPLPQGGA